MTRSRMARISREINSEISETTAKGTPSASIGASIRRKSETPRQRWRARARGEQASARQFGRIGILRPGRARAVREPQFARLFLLRPGFRLLGADAFDPLAQAGQGRLGRG